MYFFFNLHKLTTAKNIEMSIKMHNLMIFY